MLLDYYKLKIFTYKKCLGLFKAIEFWICRNFSAKLHVWVEA